MVIERALKSCVSHLYGVEDVELNTEKTNSNFEGDVTVVVFPLLRHSRKSPEATASELGEALQKEVEIISSFNVVKGFLNLSFNDPYWLDSFRSIAEQGVQIAPTGEGKTVVVEYSSPNTNKPLHLGHIRNNVLGHAYCTILEATGHRVIRNNLVNDRGIHICKSMLAWKRFGNGENPETSGLKGDHLVGKYYVIFDQEYKKEVAVLIKAGQTEDEAKENAPLIQEAREFLRKWEKGDPEIVQLWKTMNDWVYAGFDQTYKRLGIHFDKIYYESETYLLGKQIVLDGLSKGLFYQNEDGSVWVDLTDDGLDQKLLLRADGTSVYMTQDIGTAELKFKDFKMDESVYVVGNEQDYHFKVLQLVLKKLSLPHWEGLFHLSYGMVDLPSGKMKSREGTVVDADDLMEEMVKTAQAQTEELGKTEGMNADELDDLYEILGLGALKYFLLRVDAKKRILFDPKESIDFQGNTGPFIQYTYTRINSVLKAAGNYGEQTPQALEAEEKELIASLMEYSNAVNDSARTHNPSLIASYVYELAKSYNKFYHQCSILGAKDDSVRDFRINLSKSCALHIEHACSLLGMRVPERM